ncbi:MAG: hypothetical protein PHU08_05485 [Dehalococcoidales bacterium]|nr:hypothetical protein [Dehalococcoidales bacterium]
MPNEQEHELKLKEADRLLGKQQIRREVKNKFYYTYPRLFSELFELLSLSESDELFFNISMHFSGRMIHDYPGDKDDIKIDWWQDPNINYSLLFQEIFDDYWASFMCFQHGFTKQCTQILRNTLELTLNVFFMKFCKGENNETIIRWSKGERIAKTVSCVIEAVKNTEFSKAEHISSYLANLYAMLSMATHSQKKMMTSLAVTGGIWVKDKMMFEPFIVLQTRSIFLLVVETELKLIRYFFVQDTEFTSKILDSIGKMEEHLKKYFMVIESIKKGYIIHRKQINLDSGKSVQVSLKINNDWELLGKHTKLLSQEEKKELDRRIQGLLLRDDTT